MRRPLALVLTLAALAVTSSPAAADNVWTQVSSVNAANVDNELQMELLGSRVVAVWKLNTLSGYSPEIMAFDPSRAHDAANLVRTVPPATDNWGFQDVSLMKTSTGGADLLVGGAKVGDAGDPTAGTSSFPIDPATATIGAQTIRTVFQSGGMLQGIALADGTPLFTYNRFSTLFLSKTGAEEFRQLTSDATTPIPFCCGYSPELGRDAAGRYWIAFYSNATDHIGLYVGRLDPATGDLVDPTTGVAPGVLLRAPLSAAVANNNNQTAFVCAATCRVVYQGTKAPPLDSLGDGRLLSWAPGEAAPTVVATGLTFTAYWAAAYNGDGRLWVAWDAPFDTGGKVIFAKLGDAAGAGGTAVNAARPRTDATGEDSGLSAIGIGKDLLLATFWAVEGKSAQFVNLVPEPTLITDGIPNPRVIGAGPRGGVGKIAYPTIVSAADVARGCVPVRAVADKPARIWARIWRGRARNTGTPLSPKVKMLFTKVGPKKVCLKIPKKPKGFYTSKPFRIVFEVRTGAVAKPAERNRPPWRTQPTLKING